MVTDRCATPGLLDALWVVSGLHSILLYFQMADLASHWYHVYSTRPKVGHHKTKEAFAERNIVHESIMIFLICLLVRRGVHVDRLYVLLGADLASTDLAALWRAAAGVPQKNIELVPVRVGAQNLAIRDMQRGRTRPTPCCGRSEKRRLGLGGRAREGGGFRAAARRRPDLGRGA